MLILSSLTGSTTIVSRKMLFDKPVQNLYQRSVNNQQLAVPFSGSSIVIAIDNFAFR